MSTRSPQEHLYELWAEIHDLTAAEAVLQWDQETYMPEGGHAGRAQALSTLAGIKHARLIAPELREAVEAAAELAEPGSDLEAQAREADRQVSRASKVPTSLAKALAEASSRGLNAWQRARAEGDFALFQGELEQLVALRREQAHAISPQGRPYDTLIDEFELGATEESIASVFEKLTAELAPLVAAVSESGVVVDESPVRGDFAPDRQLALARLVVSRMGFDFQRGRIDGSAHPFCTTFSLGDVRLTWRSQGNDLRPALFGIVHEAGHGMYEQGLPEEWARTPIGQPTSMAIHESQSRLWENLVGRSRAFWRWALPHLQEAFPDKRGVGVDDIWPALHTVAPSLIRVEADEATYNLHVIARFEIERRLIAGEVEVAELPALWDDTYEKLLGVRPANAAEGVLQDIHWSMGAFGYFPSYALGNLVNAQLYEAAERDLGSQEANLARGEFAPLLGWLRQNIHSQGGRWRAEELVERATGSKLSPEPFLRYIRSVTEEVYGVAV